MKNIALIVTIFLLSGCGINQIKDLSIPDPQGVDSLGAYLTQKMGEPKEQGRSWGLYNVYTDYNDGECRNGQPRTNSTHITEYFFAELLSRYALDKNMYLIHSDENIPSAINVVYKPYLLDKSSDAASFSHASALVLGEPLSNVAKALDREKYILISETKPKPQKYGDVFYLSSSPDTSDIQEAVVIALHSLRWLTTNKQCKYSEYHWTIFHVNHIDRQYISDISRAEREKLDQERQHRQAIINQKLELKKNQEMERVQLMAAQESFEKAAAQHKQVGDMVGSSDNVLAYVEAVSGDKIKLSIIGKVQPLQKEYYLFHQSGADRHISTRKTRHDTIWALSKDWALVSLKLDL